MVSRKELLSSKEYWLVNFQNTLFEQVEKYLDEHQLSKTNFAKKPGVSKGYISQILNGSFDHKVSKLIELSLAIEKVPHLKFDDLGEYISADAEGNKMASVASKGNRRKKSEIEYTHLKKSLPGGKTPTKRAPVSKDAKRKEEGLRLGTIEKFLVRN